MRAMDFSRRSLLKLASILVADAVTKPYLPAWGESGISSGQKIVVLITGGVRREETFSPEGIENIPHLVQDLAPQALFYRQIVNQGVTAHYNSTTSILTGNWQRTDDWGKLPPASPTIFVFLRKHSSLAKKDVWVVSSNKALTSMVGASHVSGYGPDFGANVIFPKQLLINTVYRMNQEGRRGNIADRAKMESELERILTSNNYEGLGWSVSDSSSELDPRVLNTVQQAISQLIHENLPVTGDEFTYLVSAEIMRRFAPRLLVITFSDVEVAHFGSYAMHLGGIRNLDRLTYQLWQEIQNNPAYKGQTTVLVLPEFGRDPDGAVTNGFFNHRANSESTRNTWMMVLGAAVDHPQIVERPLRHVDLCPTMAALLECKLPELQGKKIAELRA
jgi:hypothetical protein